MKNSDYLLSDDFCCMRDNVHVQCSLGKDCLQVASLKKGNYPTEFLFLSSQRKFLNPTKTPFSFIPILPWRKFVLELHFPVKFEVRCIFG